MKLHYSKLFALVFFICELCDTAVRNGSDAFTPTAKFTPFAT